MSPELHVAARDLIALEGWLLDQRLWDEWLALYLEEAEYWLPCWDGEHALTSDPSTELSLIYYQSRAGLEDRVFRLRTGRSLASSPLPRTCHLNQVTRITADNGDLLVESNWTTHSFRLNQQHCFFGQQTHRLRSTADGIRIAKRTVIVANDRIPNVLDIYSV
jgi:3-phenylpropionate/cinnamic acid dioxygenase small subunit